MSEGLPIQIDPLDLARNQVQLEGRYAIADMPRLADYQPTGDPGNQVITIRLGFSLESSNLVKLTGNIRAPLQLTCERCLQPLALTLELEPVVYFDVSGESIDELDDRDIVSLDGPIDLKSLVEDEILLALPMIPMHESGACEAGPFHRQKESDAQKENSPFAKLAVLKKKGEEGQ